jgi:UDP-2,3-diacylglucosamine hydrolase
MIILLNSGNKKSKKQRYFEDLHNIALPNMKATKPYKAAFASDFHLGVPDSPKSRQREELLVKWLDERAADSEEIYLLGDIFDFWFEYKKVVPKGFVRLLGKLAQICDAGVPVHIITGNHDLWMFGYLEEETGVIIHKQPIQRNFGGKSFFIGHGDGLGPGDYGYKFIKKVFTSPFFQWCFRQIHPDTGIRMANYFSGKSRDANYCADQKFLGEENEWLIVYCKKQISQGENHDYFVFGHRHLPLEIPLNEKSTYINLGDWISHFSYAVFDGQKMHVHNYKN